MNNLSFDIRNSKDFLGKLIADFDDYLKSDNSSRISLNCAMTSWHLTDWVYHEFGFVKEFSKLSDYQAHIKERCPSLQIMHDISNGSKHYKLDRHKPKIQATERKDGAFDNTFDFAFDRTMLRIVMPNNDVLIFDNELKKTIIFWTDYLIQINE
jgi:hypothetical protein